MGLAAALAAGCTAGGGGGAASGSPAGGAGAAARPGAAAATGPSVEIEPASRGQMLAAGAPVQISGRALDARGAAAARVTLDGGPVAVARDGSFSGEVTAARGLQRVKVEAVDGAGASAAATVAYLGGAFVPDGSSHPAGAAARLNRPALAELEAPIAAAIAGVDLGQQLALANPLFSSSDWWGSAEARASGARFASPSVSLVPKADALGAAVTIRNLEIDFTIDLQMLFSMTFTGHIAASEATVETDLVASADPAGLFHVQARGTSVSFTGFAFDLDELPVVDQLLRGAVEQAVEDGVKKAIGQEVPPQLESALDRICQPQARQVFGGFVLTMVFRPEAVIHDADGIGIRLSTLFVGPRSPLAPAAPGSLAAAKPLGPLDLGRGASFALADSFFDQIFYTMWRAGFMSVPIDAQAMQVINPAVALDSDLLRFYFPSLRDALPAGLPAMVHLDPLIPPIVQIPSASGLTQADVEIGDAGISIYVLPAQGPPIRVLRGVAQVHVPMDVVGRGPFAALDFDAMLTEATADVVEAPLAPVAQAELEGFLRDLLPSVLACAAGQIQGFRMPEPAFGGWSASATNITAAVGAAPGDSSVVISGDYR
jgi:hypothetical protein